MSEFKLLTYKKIIDVECNKKWDKSLYAGNRGLYFFIKFSTVLRLFNGVESNRIVHSKELGFEFNPFNWKIGEYHQFYDGCNCSYHYICFSYYNEGGFSCKKCDGKI